MGVINKKPFELETVPFNKIGDIELVKRALKVLKDHYPGYVWQVGINDNKAGGIMYILNMSLVAEVFGMREYGYVLFLTTVYADPNLKCVVRAGGEILERGNMARGKFREEQIDKIDGVKPEHQPLSERVRLYEKALADNILGLPENDKSPIILGRN